MPDLPPANPLKPPHRHASSHRLVLGVVVAAAATVLASAVLPASSWQRIGLLGWNAGALAYVLSAWWRIARAGPKCTARHAATDDPGRNAVWVVAVGSSAVSLFLAAGVLHRSLEDAPAGVHADLLWPMAAIFGMVAAWFMTHTAYTLRYAHLFYRGDAPGGLQFPVEGSADWQPCDRDFAYFSFTIGMCMQTADVAISAPRIRRAALWHALLSFVYNMVILALAIDSFKEIVNRVCG